MALYHVESRVVVQDPKDPARARLITREDYTFDESVAMATYRLYSYDASHYDPFPSFCRITVSADTDDEQWHLLHRIAW